MKLAASYRSAGSGELFKNDSVSTLDMSLSTPASGLRPKSNSLELPSLNYMYQVDEPECKSSLLRKLMRKYPGLYRPVNFGLESTAAERLRLAAGTKHMEQLVRAICGLCSRECPN